MQFHTNTQIGGWDGSAIFRGRSIDVHIDAGFEQSQLSTVLSSSLGRMESQWNAVTGSLVSETLKLFNESWRDADDAELSPDQFLDQIYVQNIGIGLESIFIEFSDGGFFSGHTITVALIGNEKPEVMLEG